MKSLTFAAENQNKRTMMNSKMILPVLRSAWRDLMKYKSQNLISVFCLSVGMVCFCVTLLFLDSSWRVGSRWFAGNDERLTWVNLHEKQDSTMSGIVYFTPELLKLLADSHLSCIRFIEPDRDLYTGHTVLTDTDGKKHTIWSHNYWVGPEWLNFQGLRSAVTGKPIPVLKPGDILMTKFMWERTLGKDVDPRGFTTNSFDYILKTPGEGFNKIVDVVDTGDFFLSEDKLYVVTDLLQETNYNDSGNSYGLPYNLRVCLAEGKTYHDLEKEMKELFPQYRVDVYGSPEGNKTFAKIMMAVFFVIGSLVLLVGLLGFLTMQTQLFRLRQREMGLRRCMGATGDQLLWLLVCQVGIVFIFVTPLTLLFTSLLADYAIPIFRQFYPNFTMDMPRTFRIELCLCLLVFLLTAALAVLSARKVVKTDLSTIVGKSHKVYTRGRSLLIVMQMALSQIFVTICFILFGIMFEFEQRSAFYHVPEDADAFRDCIALDCNMVLPSFVEKLKTMEDVEDVSLTGYYSSVGAMQVDNHFLPMLGLEIEPPIPLTGSKEGRLPVYTGHIGRLAEDSVLLGYVPAEYFPESYKYSRKVMKLYVCETDSMLADRWIYNDFIVVKAKPHRYGKAWKEAAALFQEEGTYRQVDAPMQNFYDIVFRKSCWMHLLETIVLVLTFVTLLSIVLTTFSSVSLDTRLRQKEVAIRKACGATSRQIMRLFGRLYLRLLIVSTILTLPFCLLAYIIGPMLNNGEQIWGLYIGYTVSVIVVTLVTLLTVGYKIYRVSKLDPAKIIKKE